MNSSLFSPRFRLAVTRDLDDCFSLDSKVKLYDGQDKTISDLEVSSPANNFNGDKLFMASGELGVVLGIHKGLTQPSKIYRVAAYSNDGGSHKITVCSGHLLINPEMQPIPVAYLQEGDQFLGDRRVLTVQSVELDASQTTTMVNLSVASYEYAQILHNTSVFTKELFEEWLERFSWCSSFGLSYRSHAICVNGFWICDYQMYSEFIRSLKSSPLRG
jgi:hypothetical protein